jgi:hypothetical protein
MLPCRWRHEKVHPFSKPYVIATSGVPFIMVEMASFYQLSWGETL